MNIFIKSMDRFLDCLFPRRCEICGEVIEINSVICNSCKNLPIISLPICDKCGANKEDCTCKKHKNEYNRVIAPYYYEDSIVKSINRLKDADMPFLSKRLGRDMTECIKEHYSDLNFDYICFVPLTARKVNKRGYNQSELLAKEISSVLNIRLEELLIKIRNNKPQKRQSQRERKVNVFGAYDVIDKDLVAEKNILLVDDVTTTGSTLNECAKMLKIYGASSVYCVCAAIVKKNRNCKN